MSSIGGDIAANWRVVKEWATQAGREADDFARIGGLGTHEFTVDTSKARPSSVENGAARTAFLTLIREKLGLPENTPIEKFPESVRAAMKQTGFTGLIKSGDWVAANGRPLTARRIRAVTKAVEDYLLGRPVDDIVKSGHLTTTLGRHPEFKVFLRTHPNLVRALQTENDLTRRLEQDIAAGSDDYYVALCANADRAHPIPCGAITPSEEEKEKICGLFRKTLTDQLGLGFIAEAGMRSDGSTNYDYTPDAVALQIAKDSSRNTVFIDYRIESDSNRVVTLVKSPDEGENGREHVKKFIGGIVDERRRLNLPNEDRFVNALMSLCQQGLASDFVSLDFAEVMGLPAGHVRLGATELKFHLVAAENGAVKVELEASQNINKLGMNDDGRPVFMYDDGNPARIDMKMSLVVERGDDGGPVIKEGSHGISEVTMQFSEPEIVMMT